MRKFERFWEVRGRGFSDQEWALICSEVNSLLETCPVPLKGAFGAKPEVTDTEISLNGKDSADPFFLYRVSSGLNSCDTQGKPYDEVVVSILAIAKKVASDILDVAGFLDQSPLRRVFGSRWETLPKGWTAESRSKLWESLGGNTKHPVTSCMTKMKGKIDNPGAYCASLADRETPGWRNRKE